MNYRLLSKVLGLLLLLLSAAMVVCLAYSIAELRIGVESRAPFALGLSALITFLAGFSLFWWGRKAQREILKKEAIAIVGLGWMICAIFGALPYMLTRPALTPAQAVFEAMSGFTTTGSTVIPDLTLYPHSILLWRATTQWLGGMGILVLFVAVLSYLGVGSKALFRHESSAGEAMHARIRTTATRLWQLYIGLSVICAVGLVLLNMSVFDAIVHTFTAISTGGFSSRNESIAFYQSPAVELWLTLFMILGGVSFILMARCLGGQFRRWRQEDETKVYLLLLALGTLIIAANLVWTRPMPAPEALRQSLFQVVSIMTTTGFATADYNLWPPLSKTVLIVLMFVGGCAGSTAGGMKVSRVVLFAKIARQEITAAFRPNQVFTLRLNGLVVSTAARNQTAFFVALTGVVVAGGTLLIAMFEPAQDMVTTFSAVVAVLFNIGPGLGEVGPTHTFALQNQPSLVVLTVLMALGRLELFAVLVLFAPSLWKRYR